MASYSTFTIANGGTTSNALLLGKERALLSIQFPAAFTGATVAVHGSIDGTNYKALYMDGSAVSVTVTVSTTHQINPRATYGLHSVKLVSAGAEGAERTILAAIDRVI